MQPDVVGLSIMTFQRKTARKVIALVKALLPSATVVVGGYDPSLAPEAYTDPGSGVDVIVHGEGDITFRELVRALEAGRSPAGVDGPVVPGRRRGSCATLLGPSPGSSPETCGCRIGPHACSQGYTMMGRSVDVVETSRGCTYDCSFCSIIEMRGRNFHTWGLDRVIADIADARARGAGVIFLVDDNITLNVPRFRALCRGITDAGLNDIDFIVQGMTSAMLAGGDDLAREMRAAGFRYVFLGIENVLDADLRFLRAGAKNAQRQGGRTVGSASTQAIELLHRHGMFVVGGLIVGNPGDTRESVEANLAFARTYVDWPYIQHPTPYPGTPMTRDFRDAGLIVNEDEQQYRRHDRGRAHGAPGRRGDRVSAVARRAVDEVPAPAGGLRPRSGCSCCGTACRCAVTPSADRRGGRGWGSSPSATRSGATARFGTASASTWPDRLVRPCRPRGSTRPAWRCRREARVRIVISGRRPAVIAAKGVAQLKDRRRTHTPVRRMRTRYTARVAPGRKRSFDAQAFLESVGLGRRVLTYAPRDVIFSQGDPCDCVMYLRTGGVRVSVLSQSGKEAIVATLGAGDFLGEGALAGDPVRLETATATTATAVNVVPSRQMRALLHAHHAFSDRFITHMLARNARLEADLIDQLFNSSEKRLARTLLLLARYGEGDQQRVVPAALAGGPRRDDRHDAVARELFPEQVPEARVHRV